MQRRQKAHIYARETGAGESARSCRSYVTAVFECPLTPTPHLALAASLRARAAADSSLSLSPSLSQVYIICVYTRSLSLFRDCPHHQRLYTLLTPRRVSVRPPPRAARRGLRPATPVPLPLQPPPARPNRARATTTILLLLLMQERETTEIRREEERER